MLQSTVFSSLLDPATFHSAGRPDVVVVRAGGARCSGTTSPFDNPRNPDVRGAPLARRRGCSRRPASTRDDVTLAPPLARVVCAWHPSLDTLPNAVPLLRTHLLAWIEKPV